MHHHVLLISIFLSGLASCGGDTQKQSTLFAVGHEFIIAENDGKNIKQIKKSVVSMPDESLEITTDWFYNSESLMSEAKVFNTDGEHLSSYQLTYDDVGRLIKEISTLGPSKYETRYTYKAGVFHPSKEESLTNGVLTESTERVFSAQGLLTTQVQKSFENGKQTFETTTRCQLKNPNLLQCTEKKPAELGTSPSEETMNFAIVRVKNNLSISFQSQPAGTSMLRLYPVEMITTENGFISHKTTVSYNEKWNELETTSTSRTPGRSGEFVNSTKSTYDSSGLNPLRRDYETHLFGQDSKKSTEVFYYE